MSMAMMSDYFDLEEDGPVEDLDALEEAACRLRRREYREALYQLSKALGRDFDALASLRPEDLQ